MQDYEVYQGHERDAIGLKSGPIMLIQRTVTASMKTINNISKIVDTVGLGGLQMNLPGSWMNHPDYSIQQISWWHALNLF